MQFNISLLFDYILLAVISIILWIRSFFKNTLAGIRAVFVKLFRILFAFTVLVIFAGLFLVFSNIYPQYIVPYVLLRDSPTYHILSQIIWILPVLAIFLIISTLIVWAKRNISIGGRVYYDGFIAGKSQMVSFISTRWCY